MDTHNTEIDEIASHLQQDTLLRFRVGPFRFCVPAVEVEGIIIPPGLTRIPLNPPHSKGVFMHHQVLTSAISLRSKFGLPDNDDTNMGQLILGVVSVGMVGFWVDEVYETVNSSELAWRNMPEFVPHAAFDRFAAKGAEVIMSTTMQQLYDVPAEEMASMLAGVRQSFDLPEDLPPIAAEGFDSADGDDSEDSFGDLTAGELLPDEDSEPGSHESNASGSGTTLEPEANTGLSGVSQKGERVLHIESGNHPLPGSIAANEGVSRSTAGSSAVVNLSARRAAQTTTNSGISASRHSTAGNQQFKHSAARAISGRTADDSFHARASGRPGSTQERNAGVYESNRDHSPFSGGTHAGAFNRLNQNHSSHRSPAYSGNVNTRSSQSYYADNESENRKQRSGVFWQLLAAALMLILLAYWFWPSSKKEPVSTIPHQNYQSGYSFREQSALAPAVRDQSNSYEAVSPPPIPAEPRATEPVPVTKTITPMAEAGKNDAVDTASSDEVYRLEGKDVTLTVERLGPAVEKQPANDGNRTETVSNPVPGYDEYVHIVVKGDTLWDIAAKYLKNPFRYPELAHLSEIANPDLIYPGDTVRIRARRNRP